MQLRHRRPRPESPRRRMGGRGGVEPLEWAGVGAIGRGSGRRRDRRTRRWRQVDARRASRRSAPGRPFSSAWTTSRGTLRCSAGRTGARRPAHATGRGTRRALPTAGVDGTAGRAQSRWPLMCRWWFSRGRRGVRRPRGSDRRGARVQSDVAEAERRGLARDIAQGVNGDEAAPSRSACLDGR
jgi:hypothetical protein